MYYEINAFEKIRLEAPYHGSPTAGHISYIELDGDPLKNLDAFEAVVRCMKESGVGYGSDQSSRWSRDPGMRLYRALLMRYVPGADAGTAKVSAWKSCTSWDCTAI